MKSKINNKYMKHLDKETIDGAQQNLAATAL